jgi:hypothetical protein
VTAQFFAFLLIFGLGHPSREPVDPAKSIPLHGRIPCDGFGAPEDAVHVQVTFSSGSDMPREFVVSRFEHERCEVNLEIKCLHKEKAGWHDVWTAENAQPSSKTILPLSSCYEWGSKEPARYILSGWYQETAGSKPLWHQVPVKQVSSQPEVYEFTAPNGGTAQIQIGR